MDDPVSDGRSAYRGGAWAEAYRSLSRADFEELSPDDLHLLGMAAYLTGRAAEGESAMAQAHRTWHRAGDRRRAAREAFWIGLMHVDRHALAPASGWFARGQRLVDGLEECAEQALLLIPEALQALGSGDPSAAHDLFAQAGAVGQRVDDQDLCALARLGEGQALVALGRAEEGMRLLDEVMVGIVAGESSPLVTGLLYCAVIETCQRILDLRRSAEWTAALSSWCEAQPDLEAHRGRCLVHRAEVLRYRGAWDDALAELERARVALGSPHHPALGAAFYALGELHRLRGEIDAAEAAYHEASRQGHDPRPGLPRLRLLQRRVEEAWSSLVGYDDPSDPGRSADILAATVDVALASGRLGQARSAANRLEETARVVGTDYLAGMALLCAGRVLLAADDAASACGPLRTAVLTWHRLSVPLQEARARAAFGAARLAMGDRDTAALELDAARRVFAALGARPDLDALEAVAGSGPSSLLTERELEVLAHAARGLTNREIAEALVLSPHTVRRHLQNSFAKLGVTTRAAAATEAQRRGLLS